MFKLKNITIASYRKNLWEAKGKFEDCEFSKSFNDLLSTNKLDKILELNSIESAEVAEYAKNLNSLYGCSTELYSLFNEQLFSCIVAVNTISIEEDTIDLNEIWLNHYVPFEKMEHSEELLWSFTLTYLQTSSELNSELLFEKIGLSIGEYNESRVENNSFVGFCSWNGGLLIQKKEHDINKLFFQVILNSFKWDIYEKTIARIKEVRTKMQANLRKAVDMNFSLLEISQDFSYLDLCITKDMVAYDQEDVDIHELFSKGWNQEAFKNVAQNQIRVTQELIELSDNIYSREAQDKTNSFLIYLSIIGLSGTLAGIISTIDFSNSIFGNSFYRFSLITVITILAILLLKINFRKN